MKTISKETSYSHTIERYSLCDAFSESCSNVGLWICYALATCERGFMNEIELEAESEEIGVPQAWYRRFNKETFLETYDSFWAFLACFDLDDFGMWSIELQYEGISVSVSGKRDSDRIAMSYLSDAEVNLLPLIAEVEEVSYSYNRYDADVKEILEHHYNMSEKRVVLAIRKLLRHKDIYDEFVRVSNGASGLSEKLSVEGYTAEKLVQEFPLSLLGAYNYLIYLREDPGNALNDLKRGLPRK